MTYLSLVILAILIGIVYLISRSQPLHVHYFPALFLKLGAGLLLGWVYFDHYGAGDTLAYDMAARLVHENLGTSVGAWFDFIIFSDPGHIAKPLPHVLVEPRSLFFTKIVSLLYAWTGQSYWVASLYLSFFSFMGAWVAANALSRVDRVYQLPALVAFLYFPTIVFWSSGVLKEAVAFPCILLIFSMVIVKKPDNITRILIRIPGILITVLILWQIKYHYAVMIVLLLFTTLVFNRIPWAMRKGVGFLVFTGIMASIAFLLSFLHPNFYPGRFLEVLQENQEAIQNLSDAGNLIPFVETGDRVVHFLINMPIALAGGLFMPLPWQGTGTFALVTGLLNLLILVLFILSILKPGQLPAMRTCKSYAIGWYILSLGILMAYATPNFGTLERYKTAYLPFFLIWVLVSLPVDKLRNIFPGLWDHGTGDHHNS